MGALSLPELLWSWTRALPGFVGFVVFLGGEGVGGCPLFGLWVRRSSIDSSNILACGAASLHPTLLRHNWEKTRPSGRSVCVCVCLVINPTATAIQNIGRAGACGTRGESGGGAAPSRLFALPQLSTLGAEGLPAGGPVPWG